MWPDFYRSRLNQAVKGASMEAGSYQLDTKTLDNILKALKAKKAYARVGILGDSAQREDGEVTNAVIGAYHEFGTEKIPMRSFLRVPIADNLHDYLGASQAFDDDVFKEVVQKKSLAPWLEKVGAVAMGIVLEAFSNRGFGKWAPWAKGYSNNTGNILVDTQQLRNSINYDVIEEK